MAVAAAAAAGDDDNDDEDDDDDDDYDDDDDDVKVLNDDVNAYNIYLQELPWQWHTEKRL